MTKTSLTLGSVWALGEHRLLCGDSRDAVAITRFLGDERISLILTDPPYAVAYVEGKTGFTKGKIRHKAIQNDHLQSDEEYRVFTREWLEAVCPFLAKKNALYCFHSDKMTLALRDGLKDSGFHFGQTLIWVKTQAVIGRMDYCLQHEPIVYGWHGTHRFLKGKDKSVLVYPKPNRSLLHGTMKPVGLLRRLILNSCPIGEIVYDPFLGSGSTLLACGQTRRRCFGVEIDPAYCQTIIDRYEKLTGIKAVLLSSPHARHA